MPRLPRVLQKIFGSTASAGEIGKFGSLAAGTPETTTDPLEVQSLSNYLGGWYDAVIGNNSPAIQDRNALDFLFARQLAYLFESGVAEWDATTTYYIGNIVNVSGEIFKSLTDVNLNNNPSNDGINWFCLTQKSSLNISRPKFNRSGLSTIVIPASSTLPAYAIINGILYKNTSDLTINMTVAGANGLDTGSVATNTIYYLYGILETSPVKNGAFRAVASVSPPSIGPTGFSTNWTYFGSFKTRAVSSFLLPFTFSKGKYRQNGDGSTSTVNSSVVSAITTKISENAISAYYQINWGAINAVGDTFQGGALSSDTMTLAQAMNTTTNNTQYITIPIIEVQTFYARVTTSTTDSVGVTVMGWDEDPEIYQ